MRQCRKIWYSQTGHRPQMTIRHMRASCWMPKAADILSEYVILKVLTRQQWLGERALMLRLNLHFPSY